MAGSTPRRRAIDGGDGVLKRVVIIGAGVAGIAAALRIAEAGWTPIVLETRRKLGGRATSFDDPRTGLCLDNCQHVVMGCCSNILDLYRRLDVLDRIQWHEETWWANPPCRPDLLRGSSLPSPFHFTTSFLRLRFLGIDDKIAIGQAMFSMIRMGLAGRDAWRNRPFSDFLDRTSQPAGARARFWEPVVVGACNLPSDRVAGNHAIQVFQEGFLAGGWHATMGLATCDLRSMLDRAEPIVRAAGGRIRLGTSVRGIAYDGIRANGVVTDRGLEHGTSIISTVPPDRLARLISRPMQAVDERLRGLEDFDVSPILGVHLLFEQPVLRDDRRRYPHLVLPDRPTHWFFDKGEVVLEDGRTLHHVNAVISAAEEWMALDEAEIGRRVVEDLHWALPASRGLEPVLVRSVKEKRATFSAVPGIDDRRPSARPSGMGIPNLHLAGDWCDTGWPATMEGAVRSGYAAAAVATGEGGVVPDVPPGRLVARLGLR
ncbi:MAG: hydroxysqualene dehydroxylase HpnE [Planctomycetota bacterium]|nr:hydroxysqualene dehydroxylase HpnE [Planctomycetota bacterium]